MKISYLITCCTALVVGGGLNMEATNALGQTEEEKTPIADSWQRAKSKPALFPDAPVKRRQLEVETTKDEVMLRGRVNSDAAEPAAEDMAKELDVVKTVKNNLEIVVPLTREAVEKKDEAITTHVQSQTTKDSDLKNADMSIQTNAGIVSLTGEVSDIMTSANASWTAWQVPDVKSVKNDLTLKKKA